MEEVGGEGTHEPWRVSAEMFLELVLAGIADGVTAHDHHGHLRYANESAIRALALENVPEDSIDGGARDYELLSEDGRPLPPDELPFVRAVRTGAPTEMIVRYRKAGWPRHRWIRARSTVVHLAHPPQRFAVTLWHDLTDLRLRERARRLESAIATRERQLAAARRTRAARELAQQRFSILAHVGRVLARGADGRSLAAAVRQMARKLGDVCILDLAAPGPRELPRISRCRDSAHEKLCAAIEQLSRRVDHSGAASRLTRAMALPFAETAELGHPALSDPEPRALLSNAGMQWSLVAPLRVGCDEVLGVLSVHRRAGAKPFGSHEVRLMELVASRFALALQNAKLLQESREAAQARDTFVGVVAHELRAPVSTLLLTHEAITRRLARDSEPVPRWLHDRLARAHAQTRRLQRMIQRMLDATRLSLGRLVLEFDDVDVAEITREVLREFEDEAANRGSELRVDVERTTCRGDRARLEQVVTNLVSNALKYGGGRPVEVRVRPEGAGVLLQVRDYGIGIRPEERARIFEKFQRTPEARRFAGLGLGLSITRDIVEAHGGEIRVDSAPGGGSTFTVRIPSGQTSTRDQTTWV